MRPFAYVSDILSDTQPHLAVRRQLHRQFPDPERHRRQEPGFTVNGVSSFDAAKLDQNQREITHYGVAAYQYAGDKLQLPGRAVRPLFADPVHARPEPRATSSSTALPTRARLSSLAAGVQADASQQLGSDHTLRFGVFFQNEHTTSNVVSTVLPSNRLRRDPRLRSVRPATCRSRSPTSSSKTGQLYGAYLQDEWKLTPTLTLNYGARFDVVHAYTHESQLSPRANLVWKRRR